MNILKKIVNKTYRYLYRALRNGEQINKLNQSEDERLVKIGQVFQDSLSKNLTIDEVKLRDKIESLKTDLIKGKGRIPANNNPNSQATEQVSYIAKNASKKENWGILLMKLISTFNLQKGIEFGTCLGISAAYQAGAMKVNTGGELVTMEGIESRKKLAEQNLIKLGLDNTKLYLGVFEEILPEVLKTHQEFDYLFIDGDHRYSATVDNFNKILPHLKENSIVVVDDIKWSEGMKLAWEEIKKNDQIAYTFDLFIVGICIIGEVDKPQNFKVSLW